MHINAYHMFMQVVWFEMGQQRHQKRFRLLKHTKTLEFLICFRMIVHEKPKQLFKKYHASFKF